MKMYIWISILITTVYGNAANSSLDKEKQSCAEGNGMACVYLASCYMGGINVKKDISQGIKYLGTSCENGAAAGCYNLGNMYARGEGVEKDLEKAKELLTKACNKGVENACFNYKILNKRTLDQNSTK